jgi:hypothetical protein
MLRLVAHVPEEQSAAENVMLYSPAVGTAVNTGTRLVSPLDVKEDEVPSVTFNKEAPVIVAEIR